MIYYMDYINLKNHMSSIILDSPAEIAQSIGRRAKARRINLGLRQDQAAQKSGMSVATLKRFENTGVLPLDKVIRLAIVLDATEGLVQLFDADLVPSSLDEVLNAKPARLRAPRRK